MPATRAEMEKAIRARSTNDMNNDFVELLHEKIVKLQSKGVTNETILLYLDVLIRDRGMTINLHKG